MAYEAVAQSATDRARSIPLDEIDVSRPDLWVSDSHWPYFERLRRDEPVHYCSASQYGPYWSITKYNDIMAIDTNHQVFSSEAALGGIVIADPAAPLRLPMFIAMDPPKHDAQRKAVSPAVSPFNLQRIEPLIRERAGRILDELPRGEQRRYRGVREPTRARLFRQLGTRAVDRYRNVQIRGNGKS